jgi:hypothetical protein
MTADVEYRRALGAYLLGALEPDEEVRLERHVQSCLPCHSELLGLGDVVADLAAVAPDAYQTPLGLATAEAQAEDRDSGLLRRRLFGVAAMVAGLATAGGIGLFAGRSAPGTPIPDPLSPAPASAPANGSLKVDGWDKKTDVAGTAILTPATWGTGIQFTITGTQQAAAPGTGCILIAISHVGATGRAASWAIPASSSTTAGERIGGSTAIPLNQLSMLLVVTDYGEPLLAVPVAD